MPRIAYLGIFLAVAIIPMLIFGAMSSGSRGYYSDDGYGHRTYHRGYNRGSSFFFFSSGGGGYGRNRGRGYSSGSYRGGGFRSGK